MDPILLKRLEVVEEMVLCLAHYAFIQAEHGPLPKDMRERITALFGPIPDNNRDFPGVDRHYPSGITLLDLYEELQRLKKLGK